MKAVGSTVTCSAINRSTGIRHRVWMTGNQPGQIAPCPGPQLPAVPLMLSIEHAFFDVKGCELPILRLVGGCSVIELRSITGRGVRALWMGGAPGAGSRGDKGFLPCGRGTECFSHDPHF